MTAGSSLSSQVRAHGVTPLDFQCQFAVVADIAILTRKEGDLEGWNASRVWGREICDLFEKVPNWAIRAWLVWLNTKGYGGGLYAEVD